MSKKIAVCKNCYTAFIIDENNEFNRNQCCCRACYVRYKTMVIDKPKANKHAEYCEKQREKRRKKRRVRKQDEFFKSQVWLKLRYCVLKKYGRECMLCGETKGAIQVDHIKPRSRYRELELDFNNLQVLCKACSLGKGNSDEVDYRPNTVKNTV